MSQKSTILLNHLIAKNPALATAIDQLDLAIVDNHIQKQVANRVAGWIQEFKTYKPRKIIVTPEGPFKSPKIVLQYLESLYGPQPWKYPLQTAPF